MYNVYWKSCTCTSLRVRMSVTCWHLYLMWRVHIQLAPFGSSGMWCLRMWGLSIIVYRPSGTEGVATSRLKLIWVRSLNFVFWNTTSWNTTSLNTQTVWYVYIYIYTYLCVYTYIYIYIRLLLGPGLALLPVPRGPAPPRPAGVLLPEVLPPRQFICVYIWIIQITIHIIMLLLLIIINIITMIIIITINNNNYYHVITITW